jgi:uncharacterized protein (DUF1330 family)
VEATRASPITYHHTMAGIGLVCPPSEFAPEASLHADCDIDCGMFHAIVIRFTRLTAWILGLFYVSVCAPGESVAAPASQPPGFMIVQFAQDGQGSHAALAGKLLGAAETSGAQILAHADFLSVQALETGSPKLATLILRWPDMASLRQGWDQMRVALEYGAPLRVLATEGLPMAGLPGSTLPNVANTPHIKRAGPPALMLVQGVATDQVAMAVYRGIIQPMLSARGAYYLVYTRADDVNILHGQWEDQALIISRWPDLASAEDFWFSDRYQNEAIPARLGASRFTVLLLRGEDR